MSQQVCHPWELYPCHDLEKKLRVMRHSPEEVILLQNVHFRFETSQIWVKSRQGPSAQHTAPCSVFRGSLEGRGARERMGTCMRRTESFSGALHLKPSHPVNRLYPNTKWKVKTEQSGGSYNTNTEVK